MIETIITACIAAQPIIETTLQVLILPLILYWLKQNKDKTNNELLQAAVEVAVEAAEQLAKQRNLQGQSAQNFKYAYVTEALQKKYPKLDLSDLQVLIEAAVNRLNRSTLSVGLLESSVETIKKE